MRGAMCSGSPEAIRKVPCSRLASSAEPTPLPETSATTAVQEAGEFCAHVEIIAAHLGRGRAGAGGAEPAGLRHGGRLQSLLNFARQAQFVFHAELAALLFDAGGRFREWWRLRWPASAAVRDCRRKGRRASTRESM